MLVTVCLSCPCSLSLFVIKRYGRNHAMVQIRTNPTGGRHSITPSILGTPQTIGNGWWVRWPCVDVLHNRRLPGDLVLGVIAAHLHSRITSDQIDIAFTTSNNIQHTTCSQEWPSSRCWQYVPQRLTIPFITDTSPTLPSLFREASCPLTEGRQAIHQRSQRSLRLQKETGTRSPLKLTGIR